MSKHYIGGRLYRQLALVILVALASSGALFFLCAHIMEEAICAYYADHPEIVREKAGEQLDALQTYVASNEIAATNREALSAWVSSNPLLVMQIHKSNRLVFDSTQQASAALHTHLSEHSPSTTQLIKALDFADGGAQVSIAVFPEHMLADRLTKALLLVCAVLFLGITLFCVRRKIRYIVRLEQEVLSIAGGNLSLPITRYGEDELASLADCIDEMRRSLTQRIQQEESRQQERHHWVASLSHDIRTPLTSLIGYLEVLQKCALPEAESGYIKKSAQKAQQLKQITDMLFSSLAEKPFVEAVERVAVGSFVRSYISGCVDALGEAGFRVEVRQAEPLCESIAIHSAATHRIFSNICANIVQYASCDFPIMITVSGGERAVALQIESTTAHGETTHGTGLGLGICENLMKNMGGSFLTQSRGDCFAYMLAFPGDFQAPSVPSGLL